MTETAVVGSERRCLEIRSGCGFNLGERFGGRGDETKRPFGANFGGEEPVVAAKKRRRQ